MLLWHTRSEYRKDQRVIFNDYHIDIESVSGLSEHYHNMTLNNNHSRKGIHKRGKPSNIYRDYNVNILSIE